MALESTLSSLVTNVWETRMRSSSAHRRCARRSQIASTSCGGQPAQDAAPDLAVRHAAVEDRVPSESVALDEEDAERRLRLLLRPLRESGSKRGRGVARVQWSAGASRVELGRHARQDRRRRGSIPRPSRSDPRLPEQAARARARLRCPSRRKRAPDLAQQRRHADDPGGDLRDLGWRRGARRVAVEGGTSFTEVRCGLLARALVECVTGMPSATGREQAPVKARANPATCNRLVFVERVKALFTEVGIDPAAPWN
jgi:hypothetical protein